MNIIDFDNLSNFQKAISCMADENVYLEAYYCDRLTIEEKDSFDEIKEIFLRQMLSECPF